MGLGSTLFYYWISASSSLSLVCLGFCLPAIGGSGFLPPCYWWIWASYFLALVGWGFCLPAIGGFEPLPSCHWWVRFCWLPAIGGFETLPSCHWWVCVSASLLLVDLSLFLLAIDWSGFSASLLLDSAFCLSVNYNIPCLPTKFTALGTLICLHCVGVFVVGTFQRIISPQVSICAFFLLPIRNSISSMQGWTIGKFPWIVT